MIKPGQVIFVSKPKIMIWENDLKNQLSSIDTQYQKLLFAIMLESINEIAIFIAKGNLQTSIGFFKNEKFIEAYHQNNINELPEKVMAPIS